MKKPDFVYVIYIEASPEKIFHALTDAETSARYWFHANDSDWKPGSPWAHRRLDAGREADIVGEVIESDPPRRLVVSWARPADVDDKTRHSRVTYEIEPIGGSTRLTVIHDELDEQMKAGVTRGWPAVLCSLKTYLETGEPLEALRNWKECAA